MDIAIFGASGLAREVKDMCHELGYQNVILIDRTTVQSPGLKDTVVAESEIPLLASAGYQFVIAIGEPHIRKRIYARFPDLSYVNVVHRTATFGRRQQQALGDQFGNIVFAGASMTSEIQFGHFGIYNLNCTVAHDCIIEDFVTIGPGANISGNVHLQEGAYIGTGSVILQGKALGAKMTIGTFATVGAGAVVTRSVPANRIVKGIPAK